MKIDSGYVSVVGGMGARALIQAALVILLARNLGLADYGASVAVISVTGFFSTLAGLGASLLHLKDVAVTPELWKESLWVHHKTIWQSQPVLFVVSSLVAWGVVHGEMQWFTLLLLVGGDLLGLPHSDLAVRSCQGRGKYVYMAAMMCALPGLRVCMLLICLIVTGGVSLAAWGYIGFLSGCAMFLVVAGGVGRFGHKAGQGNTSRAALAGLGFAIASASTRIHADADKAIIARVSSMSAAGEYSLAYRLMDVLLLPVNGFIEWSIRALFRHGREGVRSSLKKLWSRWLALFALALFMSCMAYLLAPFLPIIFGSKYQNSVEMAHWLALLPLTTTVWVVMRSTAATAGRERLAGAIELLGAALNVTLCIALVINQGWRGAVVVTYATHLSMAALLITIIYFQKARRAQD